MGKASRWFTLIGVVSAVAVGALFAVQNSLRLTNLSLNLWFVAFELKDPLPVPYLLIGAFGGGLVLAGALGSMNRMGLQRRIRQLEQDVARRSVGTTDEDWT